MSFGFSVGDFLAVVQLATKIRKDFVGAPSQFSDISHVLRSLSIVIQDADIAVTDQDLDAQEAANLNDVIDSCKHILSKLECTVEKYSHLATQQTSLGGKLKRAWKRLSLEPEDIRELRSSITVNITLLTALTGQLTGRRARDNTVKLVQYQQDSEKQTILDWLTDTDYASQQNDFVGQRQAGTGQWLLDSTHFEHWIATKNQTLFCPGIPGAGKTILTSIVVAELPSRFQDDCAVVAYLYCNFKRQNEQKLEHLLAGLLKQLVQQRSPIPESLKSLYDQYKYSRPSANDISTVLHSVAARYSRVFILVDALDECQSDENCQENLLSEIFSLQASCGVNFFATSRFLPDITEKFEQTPSLEIRANKQDVERYVNGHINILPRFVQRDPELQQDICSNIVEAIDGMFLLAQLHLNSLRGKRAPTAIRDALKKLPTGSNAYDRAYSNAMERIEGQLSDQEELAKDALAWITCAKRPLTTLELQHALAVQADQRIFDKGNIPDIEDIVSVCAGLITVDEESGIIRLVHYTAQKYFERMQMKWFPTAESDLATALVAYLSLDVFGSGFCDTDISFEERLQTNPLYSYAASFWGHHARQVSNLHPRFAEFLQSKKLEGATQALLARKKYPRDAQYSQRVPKQFKALHLAAYFGLAESITVFLQSADVDSKDTYGQTPLSWAAANGQEGVVMQLLGSGADGDSKDIHGQTPLCRAAQSGHEAVVKMLLDDKADVESKDTEYGQTPLSWAAQNGHGAVVKLLLDAEADLEAKDADYGRSPLSWAAANGHEAIVKQLIDANADVESKDTDYGRTPLSRAAENGNGAIVKLLLDAKADAESKDELGRTPLLRAAEKGYEAVIKQLLDARVDVDSKDTHGWTPLSWAATNGHEAVVRQLLNANANVNSRDTYGQMPLWRAVRKKHEAIVLQLLDANADISAKDQGGQTPLLFAAQRGNEAIVKQLIDAKGDVNAKDNLGWTPLSHAAAKGHETVVKQLVDADADIDSMDNLGRTPLSRATAGGHEEVVKQLLHAMANVELKDKEGQTPLSHAAANGHEAVIKLLQSATSVQS